MVRELVKTLTRASITEEEKRPLPAAHKTIWDYHAEWQALYCHKLSEGHLGPVSFPSAQPEIRLSCNA